MRDRFIKIWSLLRPLLDAHQGAPTGFRQRSEASAKFDTVAFLRCRIFLWQESLLARARAISPECGHYYSTLKAATGDESLLEQGNRILVLQHLVKMFLNPAGPFAFGSDADAGGFLIYVVDESL